MNDTIPRPRWAQLTYASQPDDAAGAAGWRVKEASDDLTAAERELLMRFIVTNFEPTDPFPGVGRPDAVYAALTRRFGHVATEHGSVTWHASQVDADGFGRAGNVFSHIVLDRHPTLSPPRHHPIALWRSAGILSPHQYVAIAGSVIARAEPEPSPLLSREVIVDFLFGGSEWRIGRFARLAGAVATALQGGPKVVLRVDDQDEAARWLAAVSLLLPLSVARHLGFSLYERATSSVGRGIRDAFAAGVHVGVVPRVDEVALEDDVVTVDLGDDSDAAAPAADLALLVEAVFFSAEDATAAFEVVDMVAQRSRDADVSEPAWALAMSVLLLGDQYPDALELAREIVVRASPPEVGEDDLLRTHVEAAAASVLTGDAEALAQQLIKTPRTSYTFRLVAAQYFFAAVDDREWLCAPSPRPTINLVEIDGLVDGARAARRAIERAVDGGEAGSTEGSVWRLRLLDFAVGSGAVADPDDGELAPLVRRALSDEVTLLARNAAEAETILQRCGPLSERLRTEHLIPVLRRRRHLAGDSVFATPPAILTGLDIDALVSPAADAPDDLDRDLAALRLQRGARPVDRGLSLARGWLAEWGGWRRLPADGALLLELCLPEWELGDVLAAFDGRRPDLPAGLLVPVILRCRDYTALVALDDLQADGGDAQTASAVRLAILLYALETSTLEAWTAGGTAPDGKWEFLQLGELATLPLGLENRTRARVAAGVWALAVSLLATQRKRAELYTAGPFLQSLAWLEDAQRTGVGSEGAASYLVARASAPGGGRLAAEIAGLAAATSRGDTTGSRLLDVLVAVPLADAAGQRAIDVVAERVLLASGFDGRSSDPATRVLSWASASVTEGDAEKLWRQWWKSRDTLSSRSGRETGDFLGGLFRNRSREDS